MWDNRRDEKDCDEAEIETRNICAGLLYRYRKLVYLENFIPRHSLVSMDRKLIGEVFVLPLIVIGSGLFNQARLEGTLLAKHSPHTLLYFVWRVVPSEPDSTIRFIQADSAGNDLQCTEPQHEDR
jgi:hypothetical protein